MCSLALFLPLFFGTLNFALKISTLAATSFSFCFCSWRAWYVSLASSSLFQGGLLSSSFAAFSRTLLALSARCLSWFFLAIKSSRSCLFCRRFVFCSVSHLLRAEELLFGWFELIDGGLELEWGVEKPHGRHPNVCWCGLEGTRNSTSSNN